MRATTARKFSLRCQKKEIDDRSYHNRKIKQTGDLPNESPDMIHGIRSSAQMPPPNETTTELTSPQNL